MVGTISFFNFSGFSWRKLLFVSDGIFVGLIEWISIDQSLVRKGMKL